MKRPICCLLCLLAAAGMYAQNPARSGKDYAVFFYVADFKGGWDALPETRTEVEAIGTKLREDYGFAIEYVPNPTKAQIKDKVLEINRRSYKEKDQLLLFFSMHGHFISNADRGYLIPADGKLPAADPLGDSWLSYEDLGTWVSQNPCRHVMLSLDACYSGAFGIRQDPTERSKSYPGDVTRDVARECREREEEALFADSYRYFSSGGLQRTPAKSKFAEAWLTALSEGWLRKVITTNELEYAFRGVKNPIPEGGIFSRKANGGDFVFIHKNACSAAPVIDKTADRNAWQAAKTANTLNAFKKYCSDFPNGEFRALADKNISQLEAQQREEQAWEAAKQANTPKAYRDFISQYPGSAYREIAELNLSTLETQKDPVSSIRSANSDLPGWVFVQGGTFSMGSNAGDDDEKPVHQVTLSDFYMSIHELTFEEYDAYCDATGTTRPGDEGWGRGRRPVINVSWLDAVNYCNWRSEKEGLRKAYVISGGSITFSKDANGYRLPTEAEWEYAARSRGKDEKWAGTASEGSLSAFGNFCDANCTYSWKTDKQDDGYEFTAPVGSFRANSLGLFDMSGNVWEWCWDWHGNYSSSAQTNPTGPGSGSSRVLRGGSWNDTPAYLRCANRRGYSPDGRYGNVGFRLARAAR